MAATVTIDGIEWARFGAQVCSRADASDEWAVVDEAAAPVDVVAALVAQAAERVLNRERPRRKNPPTIVRSQRNVNFAAELGLQPDELAEWLTDADAHDVPTRVAEERLDEIAETLGLTGEEIRDRFAGRHAN